jgi:hypothetical protein
MSDPLDQMMQECAGDEAKIGMRIAGVLEFLTLRAIVDKPFFITTENEDALVLFAADEDAKKIREALKDFDLKDWHDPLDDEEVEAAPFIVDADPGDENESAS